jgi:hypothetical protein
MLKLAALAHAETLDDSVNNAVGAELNGARR